ncbi:MAG: hypothetical protein ACE5LU_26310 [Anaerolineae bacterium]
MKHETLLFTLTAVAGLDLAINRTLTRIAIFMPKKGVLIVAYQGLVTLGNLLFNLAALLTLVALAIAVHEWLRAAQAGSRSAAVAAFALASLGVLSLLFLLVPADSLLTLLYQTLVFVALVALVATADRRPPTAFGLTNDQRPTTNARPEPSRGVRRSSLVIGQRAERALAVIPLALLAGTFACVTYFKAIHAFYEIFGLRTTPPAAQTAFHLGELLAVLAPLAVTMTLLHQSRITHHASRVTFHASRITHHASRFTRRGSLLAICSLAAGGLFTLAYLLNPRLTAIIATWSLGFSLYLPFPAYTLALACAIYSVGRLIRQHQAMGYGLALIFIAGYTTQLSSQVLLSLLGFALLSAALEHRSWGAGEPRSK